MTRKRKVARSMLSRKYWGVSGSRAEAGSAWYILQLSQESELSITSQACNLVFESL